MTLLSELMELSYENRVWDQERLDQESNFTGDFQGSVTGTWVRLSENGGGIVSYNNKEYVTVPLGFVSVPAGTPVELNHAEGLYYSKF